MRRQLLACTLIGAIFHANSANRDEAVDDIFELSLNELLNIEIQTATKQATRLSEAPASVTVITQNDISDYGWDTLADVLNAQEGFLVFSDRIYDFLITRGSYQSNDPNSRVLLLLNGHSVIEHFGYFNGQLASVDLANVKQIDIVRGPGSAVYGTNAMYAVINVITYDYNSQQGISAQAKVGAFQRTQLALRAGKKFSNQKGVYFSADIKAADKQSLYFNEYDNEQYENRGHSPDNGNKLEKSSFYMQADWQSFSIRWFETTRKKNVPTGLYGGSFDKVGTFFQDKNGFIEAQFQHNLNERANLFVRAYSDHYKFKGRFLYEPDETWGLGPPYESERNIIETESLGIETNLTYAWNEANKTLLGIEFKQQGKLSFLYASENDPERLLNEVYNMDVDESLLSWFVSHHTQLSEKLSIELGAHYDDYETAGSNLSSRVATSYQLNDKARLKLLYGEAFKAPNLWQQNGGFYLTGNPNLAPEELNTTEVIFNYDFSENLIWQISIYNTETTNAIGQSDEGTFVNGSGIESTGMETRLTIQQGNHRAYFSHSQADSQFKDTNTKLPFVAPTLTKAGWRCKSCWQSIDIALELQNVSERRYALQSLGKLPGYTRVNSNISYAIKEDWDISLRINNLLDESIQEPAFLPDLGSFNLNSVYPVYDIPANGREFILSASYNF